MPEQSKPLFSRPVLAAIMLISTLGIWALNLTAPSSKLPAPNVEQWQTSNQVPVSWLSLPEWEGSNRLELRLIFTAPLENTPLTQQTLAMLMSDSLPISTSTINQRLAPLAAKAHANFNREQQVIGLTLSNESQYLTPTWQVLEQWLAQPSFKLRTFSQLSNRPLIRSRNQYQLQESLFQGDLAIANSTPTLEQISKTYQDIQAHLSRIVLVGHLPHDLRADIQNKLNTLSAHFSYSAPTKLNAALAEQAIKQQGQGELWQSHSALPINPLQRVSDWISLQLWGGDLVQQLNQQDNISFTQLNLALSAQQPWAWWSVQYQAPILVSQSNTTEQRLTAHSFAALSGIPSANEQERFNSLFSSFKEQLESQVLTPSWWSQVATQIIATNGTLTLDAFAQDYKSAIDEFNREAYRASLEALLLSSHYQEIQIYQ